MDQDEVERRIDDVIYHPKIGQLVLRYFSDEGPFAGRSFDFIGREENDENHFTRR